MHLLLKNSLLNLAFLRSSRFSFEFTKGAWFTRLLLVLIGACSSITEVNILLKHQYESFGSSKISQTLYGISLYPIKEQKIQFDSLICNRKSILSVSIEVHNHILLDSLEYSVDI